MILCLGSGLNSEDPEVEVGLNMMDLSWSSDSEHSIKKTQFLTFTGGDKVRFRLSWTYHHINSS